MFGQEWAPSAPLFQILAIAGVFQAVSYPTYWVFLARGLTGSHFRYSLISRSLVIVCALVIGGHGIDQQRVRQRHEQSLTLRLRATIEARHKD